MKNKSTYTISSSLNEDILEIIYIGKLTNGLHDKIVSDTGSIIRENNVYKVLIDISALNGRLGITDTYQRVRNFPPRVYKMRFAVVNKNGQDEIEQFQETTASNAGIQVKWFTNPDAARAWL
ncbi:MAG: hypothetical protein JW925_05835, partial [Syntrophaceae bacterium]|nr:hypothetical protein [Syntrophaceae bacterium]